MKTVLLFLVLSKTVLLWAEFEPVHAFQKALIDEEITGSNVAMVFQEGEVTYHHTQNSGKPGDKDIGPDTLFPIFSMTKPVTTVAVLMLSERGMIDLEDPVSKYLPQLADPKCKGESGVYDCVNELKIIHLLSHRSGYYYYGSHYIPSSIKYDNLEEFVEDVSQLPLEAEPGSRYQYGINQSLLGCVVQVITGESYYTFLKENIFDPLEMKNTKFHVTDEERANLFQPVFVNSGHLKGFTADLSRFTFREDNHAYFGGEGLVSTISDYAKFCEMLIGGGVYNGVRLISEDSIDLMTSKHSEGYPLEEQAEKELVGFARGLGGFVLEDPEGEGINATKGIYGWQGGTNTHFWIDREKQLFAILYSRSRSFSWDMGKRFRAAVYGSLR